MKAHRNQTGTTLVELLVVLFIFAVAAGMINLATRSRTSNLEKEAAKVQAALRTARAKAILKTSFVGITFDTTSDTFRIFEDIGPDGLAPGALGYTGPDSADPNDPNSPTLEANGIYDVGHCTQVSSNVWRGECAEPSISLTGNAAFGLGPLSATDLSPDGVGTQVGSNPVPATNQTLVFGPTGRLIGNTASVGNVPSYFVYLEDVFSQEVRAIRVDPWVGSTLIYRWRVGGNSWDR